MAEFNSSTFGTISGRHGSAVATTIKKSGKSILKLFRPPTDPKTAKQEAHRSKFAFLVAFLACMRELLNETLRTKGGYNQGFALAMQNAIIGVASNYSIDYSKLVFTVGGVTRGAQLTAAKLTGTTVKVDWNANNFSVLATGGAKPNEAVNLIFYNDTTKECILIQDIAKREAGTAELECPDYWSGNVVQSWIYFSRAEGKNNSNSDYIGEVQL
ncbi:MAG: DUF6266 family protein [Paludibacter sp.]